VQTIDVQTGRYGSSHEVSAGQQERDTPGLKHPPWHCSAPRRAAVSPLSSPQADTGEISPETLMCIFTLSSAVPPPLQAVFKGKQNKRTNVVLS